MEDGAFQKTEKVTQVYSYIRT